MIPQSELDRIRKEAKESSFIVREVHGNYEQALLIENGYIAGASSEYLRSASRIQELLQAAREVVELHKLKSTYIIELNRSLGKLESIIGDILKKEP